MQQRRMTGLDWLRLILGLGALWMALTAFLNLVNGPLPLREELSVLSGRYLRLERAEDSDNLYLFVETDSGVTERLQLSSILELDTAELARRLTPGETVTVGYQNDSQRNVYELLAADGPILSYEHSAAADRENRYWGYGLTAVLTAAALGLLLGWTLWEKRKKRHQAAIQAQERGRRAAEAAALTAREPVVYSAEERAAVEAYIHNAFGPIAQVFHEPPAHDVQLDIAVIPPSEDGDFYKLVTIGMGARRMDVPAELVDQNRAFAELVIFLPPDWNLLGSEESDIWPFHWLKKIARAPLNEVDWVGAGHLLPTDGPVTPGCDFYGILLTWAAARPEAANQLLLSSGKLINFYQLCPVDRNEMAYWRERGAQRLWNRMMEKTFRRWWMWSGRPCATPLSGLRRNLRPSSGLSGGRSTIWACRWGIFPPDIFRAAASPGTDSAGSGWPELFWISISPKTCNGSTLPARRRCFFALAA